MLEASRQSVVILVAEDDAGDQELIRRAIGDSGIAADLHIVPDGGEAMDYLLGEGVYSAPRSCPTPDLILLDLNMPRVSGHSVLEQIQVNGQLRSIPTVVLTTSDLEEDVRKAYEAGAKSYITKPPNVSDFIDILQKLEDYWFHVVRLPNQEGQTHVQTTDDRPGH